MRDDLERAQQITRQFHSLHDDVTTVWRDEAARQMEGRWLAPFRGHQLDSLHGLTRQADQLDVAVDRTYVSRQHLDAARTHANVVATSLTDAARLVDEADVATRAALADTDRARADSASSRQAEAEAARLVASVGG